MPMKIRVGSGFVNASTSSHRPAPENPSMSSWHAERISSSRLAAACGEKAAAKAQAEAAKGPASALRLRLDAAALPATVIDELRDLLISFPGESEVMVELSTRAGPRMLRLGPDYRVERSTSLHAELQDLLGSAILTPAGGGDGLVAGAAA